MNQTNIIAQCPICGEAVSYESFDAHICRITTNTRIDESVNPMNQNQSKPNKAEDFFENKYGNPYAFWEALDEKQVLDDIEEYATLARQQERERILKEIKDVYDRYREMKFFEAAFVIEKLINELKKSTPNTSEDEK